MVKQVLIALDQLLNALLGGMADETLSARAHRLRNSNIFWMILRGVINALFFWQEDHCKESFEAEIQRKQLPKSYRF